MGNLLRTSSDDYLSSRSNRSASSLAQQLETRAVAAEGKRIADRSRDLGDRLRREHAQRKHSSQAHKPGWMESIFKGKDKSTPNTGWVKH